MGDIAKRSRLAVQTISYFFGTKSKLMSQLITSTVQDAAPMEEGEFERAMEVATDPDGLLDIVVSVGHPILHAVAPLMDAARIGGLTDPEVAEVYQFHENWRRSDFAKFIANLDRLQGLRADLTPEVATDIAVTVFGVRARSGRAVCVGRARSRAGLRRAR